MSDETQVQRVAPSSRPLTALLWVVAAAVLIQAILAGLFISSTAPARLAHLIVGALLPWLALAPAVVALMNRRRLPSGVVTGSVLLPVALWAQEGLGHMPFAASTAIHVPVGVVLFGGSVVLALISRRSHRSG